LSLLECSGERDEIVFVVVVYSKMGKGYQKSGSRGKCGEEENFSMLR
jgi:hypothetical protein